MSDSTNKHGLPRSIPPEVKQQLRQEAGFGCVKCGIGIAHYEHIDPEFKDAKTHDPEKMAYLCARCHGNVTRGFWSKDMVWEAKAQPFCIKNGHCHEAFDIGSTQISLIIGNTELVGVDHILLVNGKRLLSILPPETESGPYRISGLFYDSRGSLVFTIEENEWKGRPDLWDITCEGGLIVIKTDPKNIALQIRCNQNRSLTIEKLDMFFDGVRWCVSDGILTFEYRGYRETISGYRLSTDGRNGTAFIFDNGIVEMGKAGENSVNLGPRPGQDNISIISNTRFPHG